MLFLKWCKETWSGKKLARMAEFCYVFYLFIYLFMAVLGLRCCTQAFSSCGKRGLLFVAMCNAVASLVVGHGL